MAKMKKRTFEKEYVQVPNETAQAPQININKVLNENPIPLESLGLLVNLWSYNYDKFELNKTELYKRFAFHKETSVKRAWKYLIDTGYMIEFKYRVGKKWEYVYIFNITPYTEEQKNIIWAESIEEYGEIWGLDFQDLKTRTSKSGGKSNTLLKKNKLNKDKELVNKGVNKNQKNNSKNNLNKKQEYDPDMENITHTPKKEQKSDYDGTEPYGVFLVNVMNEFYTKFAYGRWNKKQWEFLVEKLGMEIVTNDEIEIYNHRGYIHNCLTNIAYRHDLKHGKIESRKPIEGLPLYDYWLDEIDEKK